MDSGWSDNPLVRRAIWGRGPRVFGFVWPRFLPPLLLGVLLGAFVGAILVQIAFQRWQPAASAAWFGLGIVAAFGYAATVAVFNVGWSRSVLAGKWLEELYLTRLSPKAVAHGLLLEFIVPHAAFATGAALGLLTMFVVFYPGLHPTQGRLPLVLVAGAFFVAPFAGIVLRNTLAYGWRVGHAAYDMSSGWSGALRMIAVVFALLMSLLLIAVMSGVVSALTISLMFCLATGDGAEGYLPQFADEPLFQEVEFL